jgi:hypothetical protein
MVATAGAVRVPFNLDLATPPVSGITILENMSFKHAKSFQTTGFGSQRSPIT